MITRIPKYLSYSALIKFETDPDEYALRYLFTDKPIREPQGQAAGVGSAFDARVKSHMYERLYGKNYKPELYSYESLFERQVEPQNRTFCAEAGDYVFECYKISGFLQMLETLCDTAIEPPRFEFDAERTLGGVPLLGKPDGFIRLPNGILILDFKVNGYCSKAATSPTAGYLLCKDGYVIAKQSKSNGTCHDRATPTVVNGVMCSGWMEDASVEWASQLSGYAWTTGAEVGDENFITMIHQCVAKPVIGLKPLLRFSLYAGPVRRGFQTHLITRYQKLWAAIQSGHIFTEMTRTDNDSRLEMLAAQAKNMVSGTSEEDQAFFKLLRPVWKG